MDCRNGSTACERLLGTSIWDMGIDLYYAFITGDVLFLLYECEGGVLRAW